MNAVARAIDKATMRVVACPTILAWTRLLMALNPSIIGGIVAHSPVHLGKTLQVELPEHGSMEVHVQGDPRDPAVVLLHGWTSDGDVNYGFLKHALGGMYAVAPDQPGHGGGAALAQEFRNGEGYIEHCAAVTIAAMTELGIDKAIVVGYSMGTAIAQTIARHYPERVNGLVLAVGGSQYTNAKALAPHLKVWETFLRAVPRALWGSMLPLAPHGLFRFAPAVHEMGRSDPRAIVAAGQDLNNFNSQEWVGQIKLPTAVIRAVHDQLVDAEDVQDLYRRIPGATMHVTDSRLGHFATADPEFAPQFRDILHDVAQRAGIPLGRRLGGAELGA